MKIRREWAMPSKDTFQCSPIRSFVESYLQNSKISVDPFARNFQGCTYTNDLNPNTSAQYHMNALEFLKMLKDRNIQPDLVVFDPPYSLNQCISSYSQVGVTEKPPIDINTNAVGWYQEKDIIAQIMDVNGVFLHFGWHTNGMGFKRGFNIQEIFIVAHGRCHYDTLCMAERRTSKQLTMFTHNKGINEDGKKDAACYA